MRKIVFLVVLMMAFTAVAGASCDIRTVSDPETVEQNVIAQKIQENGFDQFTEDEWSKINEAVDEIYTRNLACVKTDHFSHTTLTGDALQQAMEAKMAELGYSTREALLEAEKTRKAEEKLKAFVVQNITVSDEEIQARYDAGVSNAKMAYSLNLAQYQADVENGSILMYVPEGYRYIKNLLVYLSADDQMKIKNQTRAITARQLTLDSTWTALGNLNQNPADDSEAEQKSREALTAFCESLQSEINRMTSDLKTLTDTLFAALQPRVDELLTKIDAGADFDQLIEEDGEDPDALIEPVKTIGYLVCAASTMWVPEFTEYSMALEHIGDISVPFRTRYGIHIVQYASDLASGEVPLAQIYDTIKAELLADKQDEAYRAQVEQWVANATAAAAQ